MHPRNLALAALVLSLAASGRSLAAEPRLKLSLVPGPAYAHKVRFGLVPVTLRPQIAMWIEDAEGRFVDTIYVTRRAAKADWKAAGGARRPEALPLWSHARGKAAPDGLYMPDAKHPLPDAVSGATPEEAFAKHWPLPASLAPGSYRIRVELNSSFDWNASYPDKLPKDDARYSEANGQPSLLWEGRLVLGGGPASARLEPAGTGSLRGEDGMLRPGLEGLTSALDLAASIEAAFLP